MFIKKSVCIIFVLICLFSPSFANNKEGTGTYEEYIFILVHGIDNTSGIFEGKTEYGNLRAYLENDMKLKGHVYAYTFTDNVGETPIDQGSYSSINKIDAREFGDRQYGSSQGFICWLERAKNDFKLWYSMEKLGKPNRPDLVPKEVVPTKYIIISYSMGNLAVRSYIYSDKVFGGEGFYQNDISKVIFVAPPFLGTETAFMTGYKFKLVYDELLKAQRS